MTQEHHLDPRFLLTKQYTTMQYTETNKDAIRTPTTKAKFDIFITRSIKGVTRLFRTSEDNIPNFQLPSK